MNRPATARDVTDEPHASAGDLLLQRRLCGLAGSLASAADAHAVQVWRWGYQGALEPCLDVQGVLADKASTSLAGSALVAGAQLSARLDDGRVSLALPLVADAELVGVAVLVRPPGAPGDVVELSPAALAMADGLAAILAAHAEATTWQVRYDRLGQLLESSDVCLVGLDVHGYVAHWSVGAERVFGWEREDALGRGLIALGILPDHRTWTRILAASQATDPAARAPVVAEGLTRSGRAGRFEWTAAGLADLHNGGTAVLVVARDLQEQHRTEAAHRSLIQLQSAGALAGRVAHEFNNHLTTVLGSLDGARDALDMGDDVGEALDAAEEAAEAIAASTSQLLLCSGGGRFVVAVDDLRGVVARARERAEAALPGGVSLQFVPSATALPVEADAGQLEAALAQLVLAGVDADLGGGHHVELGVAPVVLEPGQIDADFAGQPVAPGPHASVWVRVRPTTPGVRLPPLDPLARIGAEDQGFGLAAVLGVLTAHSGGLRLVSDTGDGALLEAVLPLTAAAGAHSGTPTEAARVMEHLPRALKGASVLVVDDQDGVRQVVCDALRRRGARVTSAADGIEALDHYAAAPGGYDLVVLDLVMPRMDGVTVLRELKAMDPHVRVIMTSGYNADHALARFQQHELAGFVQKPFSPRALVSVVGEVLAAQA